MRQIKLQQYIPIESRIHQLRPQIKIIVIFLNLWIILAVQSVPALIVALSGLTLMLALTKIPWQNYWFVVKRIKWLLLFLVVLNLLFRKQGVVLWDFGFWQLYSGAIGQSIQVGSQLLYMMLTAAWFMYTTTPLQLISGIEVLLTPLKKLGVRTERPVLVVFIIFRFIPILLQDFEQLQFAQASRGAHIYRGSLFQRMHALPALLIPLFETALFHAQQNAKMLVARRYDQFQFGQIDDQKKGNLSELQVIVQNFTILLGIYWFNYQGVLF